MRDTLRVLVVVEHSGLANAIEQIVRDEGDSYQRAMNVEQAVEMASTIGADVAFVDLSVESGATLALCHHLPSLCPGVVVQALVAPGDLLRGGEALSLGAAGVIVMPPTGDAIARVLADVKNETDRKKQVSLLEQKLARERKRLETYDRLVRFARGAAPSDAVRAIVDGVSQLSSAEGVALYATFGKDESERILLAALGSALDLPSSSMPADLSRLVQARGSRVVPLVAMGGELGMIVLDHAPATPEPEIAQLADLAAAMLSLVDRQEGVDEGAKLFPPRQFRSVAERLLTLSARHHRRSSVIAVSIPPDRARTRDDVIAEISDLIRTTDALCGLEDGDLLLFLPETTGIGAHACRRRIHARLAGERRAKPSRASVVRSQDPKSKSLPVSIGVSTFPHDGDSLKELVRRARSRAQEDARSPVHPLGLEQLGLGRIVDTLIARPMFDAGPRSPYPLDVACSALFSLVARACFEAQRGGPATVVTTLQPGLGVAAAARQVVSPKVLDVRGEEGCDNVEAICVEAEHGSWVCCGRIVGERFRGVHAADPLLADVVARQIAAAGGPNAG